MSDDDFGFSLPAFKADEALVGLKRQLRDLRLAERGKRFEWGGKPVAELVSTGDALSAKLARRWVITPEWDTSTLRSAADVRKWIDELKKRMARWTQDD